MQNTNEYFSDYRRNKQNLLIIFLLSRILMYTIMPMEWSRAYFACQVADLSLLRDHYWQTLFHLHCQPPLFNALIGIAAHFPDWGAAAFTQLIFAVLGALMTVCFYDLAYMFTHRHPSAFCLSLALVFFPTLLFSERWVYYTHPVTVLLVLAAWLLGTGIQRGTRSKVLGFLSCLAAIVLMRSFFHLVVWLLPLSLLVFAIPTNRPRIRLWALSVSIGVTVLVAGAPYVRNAICYGMFTGSTWQGMSAFNTTAYVDKANISKLVEQGKLTPLVFVHPFSSPEAYLTYYQTRSPATGIPILDAMQKTSGGDNLNHPIIARASREYQKNTLAIIRHYPMAYLKSVANSAYIFLGFTPYCFWTNWQTWVPNASDSALMFGVKTARFVIFPIAVLAAFILAAYFFARVVVMRPSTDGIPCEKKLQFVSAFCLFNMLYVFGISNGLELGESCIMRVPIDPFILLGAGSCLLSACSRRSTPKP